MSNDNYGGASDDDRVDDENLESYQSDDSQHSLDYDNEEEEKKSEEGLSQKDDE